MTTLIPRPKTLPSISYKVPSGLGNIYFSITWYQGRIFEIFGHMKTMGSNEMADMEGLCRMASRHLRYGQDVEDLIEQLSGISGDSQRWNEGVLIKSLPDALAFVLNLARQTTREVHLWRIRALLSSEGVEIPNEHPTQLFQNQLMRMVVSLISEGAHDGTLPELSDSQKMMMDRWEYERVHHHGGATIVPLVSVFVEYQKQMETASKHPDTKELFNSFKFKRMVPVGGGTAHGQKRGGGALCGRPLYSVDNGGLIGRDDCKTCYRIARTA